jgi:hypothetical protein
MYTENDAGKSTLLNKAEIITACPNNFLEIFGTDFFNVQG